MIGSEYFINADDILKVISEIESKYLSCKEIVCVFSIDDIRKIRRGKMPTRQEILKKGGKNK